MSELSPEELRSRAAEAASELGFDSFGVAHVGHPDEDRERLLEWLTRGYHAAMDWMARDAERRWDIRRVLPQAQSVISLAVNYYAPYQPADGCCALKVSRYAWGEDYHRVLGRKLKSLRDRLALWAPNEQFVTYVDTGPLLEKAWAERAGVGWIGKNGCLITRDMGSWVFLGEIITTARILPDQPHADYCGSCTRCLEACPTDAIVEPRVVDSSRCISYWTIEDGGEIPADIAADFDGWIFGCDICQDVCPWNKFGRPTTEPAFAPRGECLCPPGEHWADLTEEQFRETFADSPIRRAGLSGLKRNILIQNRDPLKNLIRAIEWKPAEEQADADLGGVEHLER